MQTLITLRFIGTNYHGFQVQQNALSVCEVLQNAMEKLYKCRPPVKGCSRTDSGVHAINYCVSYTPPKFIENYRLPLALNRFLPEDIRVMGAKSVSDDFHARYSAVSKEYIYRLLNSRLEDPFKQGLAWRNAQKMDLAEMQVAAHLMCGTNDYASFMSASSGMEDTVRTVDFFNVVKNDDEICFHVCANGYLYNMVRIMVGTLIEVGAHRIKADDIPKIIASKNRALCGDTVPAHGLYLYKVNYGESYGATEN